MSTSAERQSGLISGPTIVSPSSSDIAQGAWWTARRSAYWLPWLGFATCALLTALVATQQAGAARTAIQSALVGLQSIARTTWENETALGFLALAVVSSAASPFVLAKAGRFRSLWLAIAAGPCAMLAFTSGKWPTFLVAAAFFIVALITGTALLLLLQWDGLASAEYIVLACGLGLGVLGLLALGLGTLSLLRPAPALAVLSLLTLGCGVVFGRALPRPAVCRDPRQFASSGLVLPLLGICIFLVDLSVPYLPAPDVTYDATYYHLPIVRGFLERGASPELPNLIGSNFPLLGHLDYTLAAMFSSLGAAKLIHFGAGILCAIAIFFAATRVADRIAGAAAALAWLATPLVIWEMGTSYNDLFECLFAVSAILAAVIWIDTRRPVYVLLVGAFVGLGFGIKTNMIFVAAPLLVTVALLQLRNKGELYWWTGAALVGGVIGAPWYLRAFMLTGNPVFPFYNGIFRSPQWAPVNETFNYGSFGMGKGPADFLLLAPRLLLNTNRFSELPLGGLGVISLLAFLAALGLLSTRNPKIRFLVFFFLIGVIAWFVSVQYIRYLLPVLPAAAILVGCGLSYLIGHSRVWPLRISGHLTVTTMSVLAIPMLLTLESKVPGGVPWNVDTRTQTDDGYLSQALRQYGLYAWMDKNIGDDPNATRILGIGYSDWPISYSRFPIYIAHLTSEGRQILAAKDAANTSDLLHKYDFSYILVDFFPRAASWQKTFPVVSQDFTSGQMQLIYANNYLYLYRVGSEDAQAPGQNLLRDPSFLAVRSGQTVAGQWAHFGPMLTDSDAQCDGLLVGDGSGYVQGFPALPDTLYDVSVVMKSAAGQPSRGKLQINWDIPGEPNHPNIEINNVTDTPNEYRMSSTSPAGTIHGIIYMGGFAGTEQCVMSARVQPHASGSNVSS